MKPMIKHRSTLLIALLFCSMTFAEVSNEESNDNSTDIAEKKEFLEVKTFSEVVDMWNKNRDSMTIAEYLSQKPEKIKTGLFKNTIEISPFRSYLGFGFMNLLGDFDATLISEDTNLPFKITKPKQSGIAFSFSFGQLRGANKSSGGIIYFGDTTVDVSSDYGSRVVTINRETIASVFGFETDESHNFNNQGIHRGIILGGGLGFQRITITNNYALLNSQRNLEANVWYFSGKIGYGYLFERKIDQQKLLLFHHFNTILQCSVIKQVLYHVSKL